KKPSPDGYRSMISPRIENTSRCQNAPVAHICGIAQTVEISPSALRTNQSGLSSSAPARPLEISIRIRTRIFSALAAARKSPRKSPFRCGLTVWQDKAVGYQAENPPPIEMQALA